MFGPGLALARCGASVSQSVFLLIGLLPVTGDSSGCRRSIS